MFIGRKKKAEMREQFLEADICMEIILNIERQTNKREESEEKNQYFPDYPAILMRVKI